MPCFVRKKKKSFATKSTVSSAWTFTTVLGDCGPVEENGVVLTNIIFQTEAISILEKIKGLLSFKKQWQNDDHN